MARVRRRERSELQMFGMTLPLIIIMLTSAIAVVIIVMTTTRKR